MARYFQSLAYDQPPRVGQPVPWFTAPAPVNPKFVFGSLGGRWLLLSFFGDSTVERSRNFLGKLANAKIDYADKTLVSFGVTRRAADQSEDLVKRAFPKDRIFLDHDLSIARRYGLLALAKTENDQALRPGWFLIDPDMRVFATGTLEDVSRLEEVVAQLPPPHLHNGIAESFAPVLVIPRVVPMSFCKALIDTYENGEAEISGFMRQEQGKTVRKFDGTFKRRRDVKIEDQNLIAELQQAVHTRIAPAIHKAYQFEVSRIERYIVARYDAGEGGFFKPHRDNTTLGTAHRRFAVTINLNAEDYDGGELRFPEYGQRRYKAPTGGAVVFSCAILHEACPVTRGSRYASLPFLYDEAGAEVRRKNAATLEAEQRPERIDERSGQ